MVYRFKFHSILLKWLIFYEKQLKHLWGKAKGNKHVLIPIWCYPLFQIKPPCFECEIVAFGCCDLMTRSFFTQNPELKNPYFLAVHSFLLDLTVLQLCNFCNFEYLWVLYFCLNLVLHLINENFVVRKWSNIDQIF